MKWLDESLPRVPHADTSPVVLPCKNPPLKRSKKIPKQVTEKEETDEIARTKTTDGLFPLR
jgi:hypothetical protein